jgi:c-di-GMP-binding flagellar brake protein YcgR
VSKLVSMTGRSPEPATRFRGLRDRRYTIRYPFAADAELIDVESGQQVTGVTSDISLGGCFICASKALPLKSRARLRLSRKGQIFDAYVVVRIVKPRVGLGVEFFDLDPQNNEVLAAWIEGMRQNR